MNTTISAILRNRWLLDKDWAQGAMPLVHRFINGETVDLGINANADDDQEKFKPLKTGIGAAGNVYGVRPYTNLSMLPEGSIAMISLSGPMLKDGGMCAYGMTDNAALVSRLANSPNVSGIILNIDSPGGQVAGTSMLADAIKAAGNNKPVIAVIDDGIAASAAMWIASAANEIYATKATDQVGSIGVYCTIADWNSHYADYFKLKVQDVYAPQSTEKNKIYKDAINGDTTGLEEDLAVIADQFINTVATNRAGKITGDAWKKGKMFYAKDAQKIGLIDGVKPMDGVVKRINSMINQRNNSNSSNTMAFEKTLVVAGATAFAVTDDGFALEEQHLNNIEAALIAAAGDAGLLAIANNKVVELQGEVDTLHAVNASHQTRIEELEAQVAELGKQPSGKGTTLKVEKDETVNEKPVPSYLSEDNPANQFADKQLKKRASSNY